MNKEPTRHIYFSPHLDDVALSCGGIIANQVQQDQQVKIVTVFAGTPQPEAMSPFARHLHAKWKLSDDEVVNRRKEEDAKACKVLGANFEHWDFPEASYRQDKTGVHLYGTYDALRKNQNCEESELREQIKCAILTKVLDNWSQADSAPILYFPLGLASHVDHRLLATVGQEVQKLGYPVFYYEEWPYMEAYNLRDAQELLKSSPSIIYPISNKKKIEAAFCYESQMAGLGGSPKGLADRLHQYAKRVNGGQPSERIWQFHGDEDLLRQKFLSSVASPPKNWRLRDFGRFLKTLRWPDLSEILPPGRGICADIGGGSGRHRKTVEQAGYQWLGLDYSPHHREVKPKAIGERADLPMASNLFDCLILWQVLDDFPTPEQALAEVSRVLKRGGVFCGSASFLEAVHRQTFYRVSPLLLEQLLRKYGFADIQIMPGPSASALLPWTWLRHLRSDKLAQLALPVTALWLVPLAFTWFLMSWIWWQLGLGGEHGMDWICNQFPFEFAATLIFVARKET